MRKPLRMILNMWVATKLGIFVDELQGYFEMPQKFYWDYKNNKEILDKLTRLVVKLHLDRAQTR